MCSGFTYEVVIVNDGSKDKTAAVAQSYVAKYGDDLVRLCNLYKNCGKGGAVRKVCGDMCRVGWVGVGPPALWCVTWCC